MTIKKIILGMLAISTFTFTSCDNDDDDTVALPVNADLSINIDGLEALGDDYVYEGWMIVGGAPISTGTFTSVEFPQTFSVDRVNLEAATAFVLSIEPAGETGTAAAEPAATKILQGDFSNNSATISSTGIVGDFSNSSGKYILATPTDADDTNEASGVWFLDNSSENPLAGLSLPTLTDGWKYEGWVVINGTPVSTGTFLSVDMADDNASSSPYKGTEGDGPAFPGEDYVMGSAAGVDFPTDLKGATIVISVEPSPDNSTAPFTLKPLSHVVPDDAGVHTLITMGAGPKASLTGSVTR